MKTVLSVDVAKNKSMIMLMNSDGEIFIDTKEINHNLEDFEKTKESYIEQAQNIINLFKAREENGKPLDREEYYKKQEKLNYQ